MTTTDTYWPLPISTEDLLRLRAAVGDRDPKLRLDLDHTKDGEDYISVTTKGLVYGPTKLEPMLVATIIRGENCWLVHHPKDGPLFEFKEGDVGAVATFLAFGKADCCRREWPSKRAYLASLGIEMEPLQKPEGAVSPASDPWRPMERLEAGERRSGKSRR
jgi:hypothetical protein